MKERPILFSGQMVRAIIDGRKTQTRRALKKQISGKLAGPNFDGMWSDTTRHVVRYFPCPYGEPGTVLLVKESAWMWCERRPNGTTPTGRPKWHYVPMREAPIFYAADHPKRPETSVVSPDTGNVWGWRLKIGRFLPAWAVRIRLTSTGVRVERLQDISILDSHAEGVGGTYGETGIRLGFSGENHEWDNKTAIEQYAWLWESINGPGSWDANPWVWVVEFRRIQS